jgi:hypothetical protein
MKPENGSILKVLGILDFLPFTCSLLINVIMKRNSLEPSVKITVPRMIKLICENPSPSQNPVWDAIREGYICSVSDGPQTLIIEYRLSHIHYLNFVRLCNEWT